MSTTLAKMSNVSTKFQVATAAVAVAAVATLTPAVMAQADSMSPAPLAPITEISTSPYFAAGSLAEELPWWLLRDSPSATAERRAPTVIFSFSPLALIPSFIEPLYRYLTRNLNFSVCLGGLGVRVGPYGTTTVTRGC